MPGSGGDFTSSFTGRPRISDIAIDDRGFNRLGATILVSTQLGIYRSTDGGSNWTRTYTGTTSAVVFDLATPGLAYMAVGNRGINAGDNGMYRSTDAGATWQKLGPIFSGDTPGRVEIAFAPSNRSVLYVAAENRSTGGLLGIWRSIDGGANWEQRSATNASCAAQCWYDMTITVDPLDANNVFFGGLWAYRSTDGASNFTTLPTGGFHVDQHVFAFDPSDPNTLYVGNDGGVFRTTTPRGAAIWTSLNTNLAITQFYGGATMHPTNSTRVLGGTQDNGTVEYVGMANWRTVIGSDGGFTAINPQNPQIQYGETQWSPDAGMYGPLRRATDGGFSQRRFGIDGSDNAQFIPPLVMDQQVPRILWFGTTKVYRTSNDGALWEAVRQGVGRTQSNATTTAIRMAPSDTAVIYVGSSDGNVLVSTDFGNTFTQRTSGIPQRTVKDFAIDPADPMRAFVVLSGFRSLPGGGHVYRTVNGGVSWVNMTEGLPDVPVNAAVLVPSGDLYIGTDLGVFRFVAGGSSWTPFVERFPNVAVFSLSYTPATKILLAATHGRGMFVYSLGDAVLHGDVNGDGRISAQDAQMVLAASVGQTLPGDINVFPRGDADCNGRIEAADALVILNHIVGAPTSGSGCVGTVR
jgi:photosystem II stability/assembly factor-like uncharacterized protein